MTADVFEYFRSGARPTLRGLACLHGAARSPRIQVRSKNGLAEYRRRNEETALDFYRRVVRRTTPDETSAAALAPEEPCWAALCRGDVALAPGSTVYALRGSTFDASVLTRITASDMVAALAER